MLSRNILKALPRHRGPATLLFRRTTAASTSTSAPGFDHTSATTTPQSSEKAYQILQAQRKHRPIAPHLSIYKPQLTWYGSAANRVTGVALSGAIYVYFAAYAMGIHGLDAASMAAMFGSLPVAVKVGIKALFALPFSYHSWNGLRHLTWDTGRMLNIKDVYRTGYAVLAATAVSTVWLALI
ncbi:hypothetical protein EDC01DRAFT_711639 [Geopyxis carbonaria]|nr:hypothetical protein EDC01DRAFT_711639 [Geopyxis carbonaria]